PSRAYDILTERVGFPPEDIIIDPNIFAVATGMAEHDGYGLAFIEAARWIRENLPHAHVSGGVSNLSPSPACSRRPVSTSSAPETTSPAPRCAAFSATSRTRRAPPTSRRLVQKFA